MPTDVPGEPTGTPEHPFDLDLDPTEQGQPVVKPVWTGSKTVQVRIPIAEDGSLVRVPGGGAMGEDIHFRIRFPTQPRPTKGKRPLFAGIGAAAVVAALLAWLLWPTEPDQGPRLTAAPNLTVDYAQAADRLASLTGPEVDDQVRDWLRTALAAHLDIDTDTLRDNLFDALPIRDDGFADLSRQAVGPGRALVDGDTLHVLVPTGDPHEARTIALLLDQYRTDSGHDPASLAVHHYTDDRQAKTIQVAADPAEPTAQARERLGYVTAPVDTDDRLREFLAGTSSLSTVENRAGTLWAGGWRWADQPNPITAEDVAVLQSGYEAGGTRPGFSLDPAETPDAATLPSVVPGLTPATALEVSSGALSPELADVLDKAVYDNALPDQATARRLGIPTDRAWLVALYTIGRPGGGPSFGQARYEGGLAGTEVGMTMFYTDYMAKRWAADGGGADVGAHVPGFLASSKVDTAWAHCETGDESGRLWFGQNDGAFGGDDDHVLLGAQPTRLFSRTQPEGTTGATSEVEMGYALGRGMRWWDQHFQAVADYEPQYARLDQIMRWSGAMDWMSAHDGPTLPTTATPKRTLRFDAWYAAHTELRERSAVVQADFGDDEEVVVQPMSSGYQDCGGIYVSGGISLADRSARNAKGSYTDGVPGVGRAGTFDPDSRFSRADGTGRFTRDVVGDGGGRAEWTRWDLGRRGADDATVDIAANPRKVAQFGELKLWTDEKSDRSLHVDLKSGHGRVDQHLDMAGKSVGDLTATKDGATVRVRWSRGPLDLARAIAESVQARMIADPRAKVTDVPTDGLYTMPVDGGFATKVGADWVSFTDSPPPRGTDPAFRLGAPTPGGGDARFGWGLFVHPTSGKPWLDVAGTKANLVDQRASDATTFKVTTRDGHTTEVLWKDGHAYAHPEDGVVGLGGTAEGAALLRDFGKVVDAQHDGLWRGVGLGADGVALVGRGEVLLVPATDPWTSRVVAALHPDPGTPRYFQVSGDRLARVDDSPMTIVGGGTERDLADLLGGDTPVYLNEKFRPLWSLADGPLVADAVARHVTVKVQEARPAEQPRAAEQPEVRVAAGGRWDLVPGGVRVTGQPPVTATTTSVPAGPGQPDQGGTVLLVCPVEGC
ncbi:hypothetical protein [Actinokineospora enzanensis]|uniref:hypothetical protein n=1 Tax=Actinokineospora enzanensis TaxID=155975 RepID=UPI0003674B59|nr:hypothetical protein [Actinokineospora enzanensis]